jgi:hypothetical protein
MSQSKSKIFVYSSVFGEIILNSSSNTSDIFLNSGTDGRCFKAHRVVLAAASQILGEILDTSCSVCGGEPEDNCVLTFADVSGNILEHFLTLCYTGVSLVLNSDEEEEELRIFCANVKLRDDNLLRCPQSGFVISGLESSFIVEPVIGFTECRTSKNFFSNDVLKLEPTNVVLTDDHFEALITASNYFSTLPLREKNLLV